VTSRFGDTWTDPTLPHEAQRLRVERLAPAHGSGQARWCRRRRVPKAVQLPQRNRPGVAARPEDSYA
jgi:hypothetical protein